MIVMTKKQKKLLYRIILSFILFTVVFITEKFVELNRITVLVLYIIPYLVAGYDVILGFFRNAVRGRIFDEEFLMTAATVGALIIGEYPESVFVMLFFQTGELFQNIAVGKSRRSISSLMEICPDTARVIRNGEEEEIFPEEAEIGETVIIRAGEKIPLDCTVTEGESTVNTSALTGESLPVEIYKGSEIKAGCINLSGTVRAVVTRQYSESTVAKILELVENSTLNKAKSEKFLTRFSRFYTPAVVIGAVALAVIMSIATGDIKESVYRALIFLVVSCPCALVISVPMSFFGGIGCASSKGVLVKGANFLEALGKATHFVFDKTGTLTTGEFFVKEIIPEGSVTEKELISLAAAAEYYSLHPIAKSIVAACENPKTPLSVTEESGLGVRAQTEEGEVLSGSRRYLEKNNIAVPENADCGAGVYVARNSVYIGRIILSDKLKNNAEKTVEALKKQGVSEIYMLTGDNEYAASATAEALGINNFCHSMLPQDKAQFVKRLCENNKGKGSVVFVGDGINDAPVLSLSHVGIAMGAIGSDAAIEAADIVIMDDSIEKCALGIKIARKTKKIVRQNVIFALTVKFAVLIFASFGMTNMWVGVFADVGVAVLAILNAMRAMKIKK